MRRPSGLTATEFTDRWCPLSWWMQMPTSRSQTATVLSNDPETMRRPSWLTPEFTDRWCSVIWWIRVPASRSQTATVLSSDPETMRSPSGLTATDVTQCSCPVRLVDQEHWTSRSQTRPQCRREGSGNECDGPSGAHRHGSHCVLMFDEVVDAGCRTRGPQTATVPSSGSRRRCVDRRGSPSQATVLSYDHRRCIVRRGSPQRPPHLRVR